ncbi:carboxylesterase family protein [Riemerella columbipharyngis]|uniref:PDZ domain-containing protein n=1 Tax=Riemerella columbipharyngis TaxID=1071918 RepID=A0A1G7BR86_9FLAO|nr:PDZ domain-containing protein [Riemerella columbipharyngis]SDE29462.1 hypothetical protein SAMN05421544_10688 [Riemerella columbipharyngis]
MKSIISILLCISVFIKAQTGTFTELSYSCADNVSRPYILYTPKGIDKAKSYPLVIYLHGSISAPVIKKNPLDYMKRSPLLKWADEGKFYLMFSYGQKGATWFDKVGTQMVLGEMNNVVKQFKVNTDKIFLSGFSDGGSGVMYMAMNNPFPFAGFIAMNGSLSVANKAGESAVFSENINNKPLYIINTDGDMLYPITQIRPTIDYLKSIDRNVVYSEPKGNHEMSYIDAEIPVLTSFVNQNSLTPTLSWSWETAVPQQDFVQGIRINEIDTLQMPKNWQKPYHLKVFNDKADFGVSYDYSYQGNDGLKVKGFKNDSATAKKMGVKPGDIIVMMGKDSITSPYTPYIYAASKKAGDAASLTVLRDGKTQTLSGVFNKGFYYDVFKRNERKHYAKIQAQIERHTLSIQTSRVKALEINFDDLKAFGIRKLFINDKKIKTKTKGIQKITL